MGNPNETGVYQTELRGARSTLPSSLRTNFAWTISGNIIYSACQWGMLVILAKLATPEILGQFALGLAICSPIIIFSNLQLRNIQATDVRKEYDFGDYFGLRLITVVVAFLIITAAVLAAGYTPNKLLVILLVGVAKIFEAISDVFYGMFQQHERFEYIARSMMMKGPLSLLVLGILFYLTGELLWSVVGLAFTWGVILLFDIRNGLRLLNANTLQDDTLPASTLGSVHLVLPHWNISKVKRLLAAVLPLGLSALLISLGPNIPRYFIDWYLDEKTLGIFAALAYLVVAGNTVVLALAQSATPRLAKYYAARNGSAFRKLILQLVLLGLLGGVAGFVIAFLAGYEILTLLYSAEYAEHVDVFRWIMVAAGISYVATFLNCGLMAARYFGVQLPLHLLIVSANSLLCFSLIPMFGIHGAVWALAVAFTIQAVGYLLVNWYALRQIIPEQGIDTSA